jgi:biopolymer transport protein ExbD
MGAKLGGSGSSRFDLGQNSEINVTPFVDVMLVLLIIFMVAAPLATVSIAVDLPPAIPSTVKPKEPVFINVQKSGALFLADRPTSLETLPSDLVGALAAKGVTGDPRGERVFIRADADVMYSDFMAVLNVLQGSGYFKVGLINEDIS